MKLLWNPRHLPVSPSRLTFASSPADGRPSVSDPVTPDDLFTAEMLAVAVTITAILALLLGFGAGHCCARRCRKDDANMPYADTDYTYFDQRQNVNTRCG